MKTSRKRCTESAVSASTASVAGAPMAPGFSTMPRCPTLRLVEEAASLEHPRAFLGGDLDVLRRQQEDLVGDALHAAVERVGQAAREIDQPLREVDLGSL